MELFVEVFVVQQIGFLFVMTGTDCVLDGNEIVFL